MRSFPVISFFLVFLTAIWCRGQDAGLYTLKVYSADSELPQNTAKQALLDPYGYCWVATEAGLVRFDGRHFRNFSSPDIPGLSNDRIQRIGVLPDGTVMALTVADQLLRITQPNPSYSPSPKLETYRKMLFPVAGYVTESTPVFDSLSESLYKRQDGGVVLTANTRSGDIYLIYKQEIFFVSGNKADLIGNTGATNQNFYNFSIIGDDVFFRVTGPDKVDAWRNGKLLPHLNKLEGDLVSDGGVTGGEMQTVVWGQEGTYIYANGAVYRVELSDKGFLTRRIIAGIKVVNLSSVCYLAEEDKYLLCSNDVKGKLIAVQPTRFRSPSLPADYSYRSFFSQVKTGEKGLISGSYLYSLNDSHQVLPIRKGQTGDHRVQYLSPRGELYCERNSRLLKYDIRSAAVDSLIPLADVMKALLPDPAGDGLFIFTQSSAYRLERDTVRSVREIPGRPIVTTALPLGKDRFLLGTERGIKWFDFSRNKIERSLLDSVSIWSLWVENDRRTWIGTYGKGFYLLEDDRLFSFPLGPGQALKTVHTFVDDGRGNFWLPTNNGLFKVSRDELLIYTRGLTDDVRFYLYDHQDGLRSTEFNGGSTPSYAWLADSLLSLPSLDGLVWFYPQRMKQPFPVHPVLIESLMLNGSPVTAEVLSSIPPGNHTIEFSVATPYFGNEENLWLEYQVEGYRKAWSRLPADGKVLLQNMPHGSYRMMFRKRNSPDHTRFDYLELPFEIAPFFYNTWWFYLVLGILLIFGSYLFTRWRVRNLQRQTYLLEKKISERTETLHRTVAELEESRQALKESNEIKDRIVSMVLHDLRSPIRFLEMMGARLAKNHETLDKSTLTERLNEIYNSAGSIYSYTNQFLTWTRAQHGLYAVRFRWVELFPIMEGIGSLYTEMARYQQNKLVVRPTNEKCYTDPNLLTAILRNLVDNAMKHTSEGSITLSAERVGQELSIVVSDTGTGMTRVQVDAFYGKSGNVEPAGLGSLLVRDLLGKINGQLHIESQAGKGTVFTITWPESHPPADENGQAP